MTGSRPGHFVSRNDSGQVVHPQAGKVTVDLASHWPCIADSVVYPPTGSMAWEMEMRASPKLHSEYYDVFTFGASYAVLTC